MANKKKNTAKSTKEQKGPNALQRGFSSVMNGSFLTRESVLGNMGFILFVAFLMICYISYGYFTEKTVRDLQSTDQELKELRSEYITVRSQLEKEEQQSSVAKEIEELGLKETLDPPHKVGVDQELIIGKSSENGEQQ